MRKKFLCLALAATLLFSAVPTKVCRAEVNYQQEMADLLSNMHTYAKLRNNKFNVVINGGFGLYNSEMNKDPVRRAKILNSTEGVLIEDMFYGRDCEFNNPTSRDERKDMCNSLDTARFAGKAIFNMEYCDGRKAGFNSYNNSIYYNAPSLELNSIPVLDAWRVNNEDVTDLKQVKTFCALFQPSYWEDTEDKAGYLSAIRNSDYDLIFIDLYFDGKELTKEEVESLKTKKNGKKRLICSYISVGEAESYRPYWQSSWDDEDDAPDWLCDENPDWEDNFKVRYWDEDWQRLLYGNSNAYLDKIINAGFDGAYFDVIDAYEYFENGED